MPGASFFQSGILTHPKNDPPFPKPSFLAVSTDLAPNSQKIAKWQYQSLKM
jgi:hypothetical protein